MKITASGGTDGANIVLFWPDQLPDNFDDEFQDDAIALVEALRNDGTLIWFPCDGDGFYTVAIFVRAPVPDDLLAACTEEEHVSSLSVRGEGFFGGMEYMFKSDRALLDKYPGMCEQVTIPDGTYTARIYSTNIANGVYEAWLVKHAGRTAKRMWDLHGYVIGMSVIAFIASLVCLFVLSWTSWFYVVALAVALAMTAIGMSRTEGHKAVRKVRDAYEKAYPSYVVHLA
jgi:hypothetical protein